MRDRLIDLIHDSDLSLDSVRLADYLLDNGVIVPPCKVGQICYKVWQGEILEVKVVSIHYEPLPSFTYTFRFNSLGILCLLADGSRNEKYSWNIYITKEEAEKALAERSENEI